MSDPTRPEIDRLWITVNALSAGAAASDEARRNNYATLAEIKADASEIKKQITALTVTAASASGGMKVVVWIGAMISSAIGFLLAHFVPWKG